MKVLGVLTMVMVSVGWLVSSDATAAASGEGVLVDSVWAGHPVGFALLTEAPHQFVAYYDKDRNMVVASRTLDSDQWHHVTLPEQIGWDSHNYLTLALDDQKHLHLSGNMHVNPLVYFRTTEPLAIDTFTRVERLIGTEESRMTYPRFFRGPAGEFIYTYRDGSSGSGNQIYNVYDASTDTWTRLLDKPLTDGGGAMNAYLDGPRLGPDGLYHVVWVWRDTSDCATNHDVSYMRSRDLRHWENVRGDALTLPVTLESPATIVDPVPPGGGVINGNVRLGFDGEKRPIVSYHKYDDVGNSQIYNARWMGDAWKINQVTSWTSRWSFSGGGSIPFDVRVQAVSHNKRDGLIQTWSHWERGRERWKLDPETLAATAILPAPAKEKLSATNKVTLDFPGVIPRSASDAGTRSDDGTRYVLQWSTLGPNRDRPRSGTLPPPAPLYVFALEK